MTNRSLWICFVEGCTAPRRGDASVLFLCRKSTKRALRGRGVSIPLSLLKLPHPKTTQRGGACPLFGFSPPVFWLSCLFHRTPVVLSEVQNLSRHSQAKAEIVMFSLQERASGANAESVRCSRAANRTTAEDDLRPRKNRGYQGVSPWRIFGYFCFFTKVPRRRLNTVAYRCCSTAASGTENPHKTNPQTPICQDKKPPAAAGTSHGSR